METSQKNGKYLFNIEGNKSAFFSKSVEDQDGNEDNRRFDAEVFIVKKKDTGKEYAVYTRNETDDKGNTTIYVSSIDRSGSVPKLGGIESDEEWSRIKDVLRELAKDNN